MIGWRAPLAAIALAGLGGCGLLRPAARTESVSLDLDSLARRTLPPPSPRVAPAPAPPPPLPAASGVLPGIAAIRPEGPRGSRVENVRALLAREAARAETRLAARLREVYAAEIEAMRFAGERETADLRRSGSEAILTAIRARFEVLAAARAPSVARLAFLEGFPDPGPGAGIVETEEAKRREAEASGLRTRIAELDAAFDRDVAALTNELEAKVRERVRRLADDLAARRQELDARAGAEAAAQVKNLTEDLDLRLAQSRPPLLPAVPPERTTVPASTPIRDVVGRVDSLGGGNASGLRAWRERLGREARIWAGLAGVEIAPRASGVRDATAEFERWRRGL